jgi:hypothetical protein
MKNKGNPGNFFVRAIVTIVIAITVMVLLRHFVQNR